jgi:alpha-D-ribose 1-methylphosphonate 5-triphosphate synthase subunit PhnG
VPSIEQGDEAAASWRGRRAELLAVADVDRLIRLADRFVEHAEPTVLGVPRAGLVPFCVREPVRGDRFIVADVLVTEAEVELRGKRGWAMRLGDNPVATLAAAICDAVAESGGEWAREVSELCFATEQRLSDDDAREWNELTATQVHFEEMP